MGKPTKTNLQRGRTTPNKTTRATREQIVHFLEQHCWPQAEALFDRVAKQNPGRALILMTKLSEFVAPRLRAVAHANITPRRGLDEFSTAELENMLAGRDVEQLAGVALAALPAPAEPDPLLANLVSEQRAPVVIDVEPEPPSPAVAAEPEPAAVEPDSRPALSEQPEAQPAEAPRFRGFRIV